MPKPSHRAQLAQLRALKQSGKKTFDVYQVDNAQDVYDEVDEDGYKKIVRNRLDQDDFVVDDNGEGYADDGREEWDQVERHDDSDDSDAAPRAKRGKSSKDAKDDAVQEQAKRDATDRSISDYFGARGATKAQPKVKVAQTQEDVDFMAGILDDVDSAAGLAAPPPARRGGWNERRKPRDLSPAPQREVKRQKRLDTRVLSPQAPIKADYDDDGFVAPLDYDEDVVMDDVMAVAEPNAQMKQEACQEDRAKDADQDKVKVKAEEEEEDDGLMEIAHAGAVEARSVNLTAIRPVQEAGKADLRAATTKTEEDEAIDASSWNQVTEKLNVVSSSHGESRSIGKVDGKDVMEEDGSVKMFWIDFTEVNGSLCLFGKVLDKKSKTYVSAFVKIDNMQRKLYFLPRGRGVGEGEESRDEVDMMDVCNEVDTLMSDMKVPVYKMKRCRRKYAFELADIPKEAEYLKLLYPYTQPIMDMNTKGKTFSHVFGTNTALFEEFVVWRKIMGPCWLRIGEANSEALKNASHCKVELLVEKPESISVMSDSEGVEPPPLTLMSVALRTVWKARDNRHEVFAISARIYEHVQLGDTTAADKRPSRSFTVLRPSGTGFPFGFEQLAKERGRGLIASKRSEAEVLAFFLAQVQVADPDVLLGHQLEGVDLSILLRRVHETKVPQWSRLGRLRRSQWPWTVGKAGGSSAVGERSVLAGRLLCDLANEAGRAVLARCQTWALGEMCSLYLGSEVRRRDVDTAAALGSWAQSRQGLLDLIGHAEADTHYIAALVLGVQLLPLTRVLTCLAGNSWARTLAGTRAERNDFILLHEFARNGFICPDRPPPRSRHADEAKRDKFRGGLVFEPQKGLYDKFVLVMDFNSLYPSIIQEYNICFTTVDRSATATADDNKPDNDDDQAPPVPPTQQQGILPRLIATLVSRRRQVKALIKTSKNASPQQLATWDIKQLALKLTANSMYGCLGYTRSRFYARPLAVLTTHKGREILRCTKQLAESKSLQVIYGDTDSVMINANVDSVSAALAVAADFKKAVNEQYRLLEIDLDNVFRRILLQAKKKYAAISLVEADGKFVEHLEVKGLDMKRREFCALSKQVSKHLLDAILSGDDAELSLARIHDYLRDTADRMRQHAVAMSSYIIYTQLGKEPNDYPNADSMPQVQVALRDIARGKTVRKGDVVSYVITGDAQSSLPAPKRAYSPADVKADAALQPDVEWYLARQIFPPVERLCANIVGTSSTRLAQQLGLDLGRYATSSLARADAAQSADLDIYPLESQVPDAVRFSACVRLCLRCPSCAHCEAFEGLVAAPHRVLPAGLVCPSCDALFPVLSLVAQMDHAIRVETSRYYEAWLVCDDSQCANRTRQMSVYGTRCLGPKGLARDCLGRMRYEYGEKAIYTQLLYFASLWDVDRARASALDMPAPDRDKIFALAEHNRLRFGTLKSLVQGYLEKCGRQWVAMDTLFGKLGFNRS
ncbi:hypothetical protein CDD81_6912 [Ophiocordyceps australis]|uniref:DNA polymerase n=1 Tax=Ophiocordyceps australis TaxID=1399860 RepID=A0A2C5Y4B7_9HYPO|nr:hypothetical protein CDD81_6912 [Ophiocordyceps australis]